MTASRRILVTGSEGFVGKHVRAALTARGIETVGVDRPGTAAEIPVDLSGASFDAKEIAERAGQLDGVIYMAATITRGSSVDAAARDNLRAIADSAAEMLEACYARSPGMHYVYCSTYKSYGPSNVPEGVGIDPQLQPQRPDPHSYGSAKALAERWLAIAAKRLGVRYAVVRPTCIYGPGQHTHNAIPIFLRTLLDGKPPVVFGTGRDVRDDVFAPDLAYAMIEACLRRVDGAFHATGDRSRNILQTAEVCCEAISKLTGAPKQTPVIDGSRPPKWWLDQVFDWKRTRELLDYQPIPLVEGLMCEARWLQAGAVAGDSLKFAPAPRTGTKAGASR
ncbi:MAG TPA: NAD(P)-dependent oxidoreductase [Polyangiales bacterium]|jgi:UDP-glucose 4-epimerase|nr:NAD(P)-dependent oxidoreductase [Polyangiales bacterium]